MKHLINSFLVVLLVLLSKSVVAEEHPFVPYMAHALKIKLSNDRTGIIQDVECAGCTFSVVKITKDSKAYVDGVEVDILKAKLRAGKPTLVSFNPETREVQTIRWTNAR